MIEIAITDTGRINDTKELGPKHFMVGLKDDVNIDGSIVPNYPISFPIALNSIFRFYLVCYLF